MGDTGTALDYGCGSQPWRTLFTGPDARYLGANLPGNDAADLHLSDSGMIPLADGTVDTQVIV